MFSRRAGKPSEVLTATKQANLDAISRYERELVETIERVEELKEAIAGYENYIKDLDDAIEILEEMEKDEN